MGRGRALGNYTLTRNLGRRVRVIYTPVTTGNLGTPETTDSWYDPQVEFLEVATQQGSSGVQ